EEHERNVRLCLLLLSGLRGLSLRPEEPTVVAESFLLKMLSLSGFRPSLSACAVCGRTSPELFSSGQGGAVCTGCAEIDAGPASPYALGYLAGIASADLAAVGDGAPTEVIVRKEARALLYG